MAVLLFILLFHRGEQATDTYETPDKTVQFKAVDVPPTKTGILYCMKVRLSLVLASYDIL